MAPCGGHFHNNFMQAMQGRMVWLKERCELLDSLHAALAAEIASSTRCQEAQKFLKDRISVHLTLVCFVRV